MNYEIILDTFRIFLQVVLRSVSQTKLIKHLYHLDIFTRKYFRSTNSASLDYVRKPFLIGTTQPITK